jgi:hypothetical protein
MFVRYCEMILFRFIDWEGIVEDMSSLWKDRVKPQPESCAFSSMPDTCRMM